MGWAVFVVLIPTNETNEARFSTHSHHCRVDITDDITKEKFMGCVQACADYQFDKLFGGNATEEYVRALLEEASSHSGLDS